jgi:YD repeat-containing protein
MTYPAARKGDKANHVKKPPAPILEGSGNVTTNSLPAARMDDLVQHGNAQEPIVQGSGSVTINGKPAARVTDKVACGETIVQGSGNVFIGDGGVGRACSVCPGGTAVGNPVNPILGAKVLFDERELDFALPGALSVAWQRRYSTYVGPAGQEPGLLGQGWRLPFEMTLQVRPEAVLLNDINGRQIRFDPLAAGEHQKSASEGFSLMRGGLPQPTDTAKPTAGQPEPKPESEPKPEPPWQTQARWSHIPAQWRDNAHCVMAATAERNVWVFAAMSDHPDDNTPWLPIALIDVYGRTQRYERNRGEHLDPSSGLPYGQLLRITDPLGRVYQLHYTTLEAVFSGHVQLRLGSVQLATQTAPLVSYRYNNQGDLSEVTDEHGRSTRAFEYDRQHRMTGHRHLGGPWSRYTYASDEPGKKPSSPTAWAAPPAMALTAKATENAWPAKPTHWATPPSSYTTSTATWCNTSTPWAASASTAATPKAS